MAAAVVALTGVVVVAGKLHPSAPLHWAIILVGCALFGLTFGVLILYVQGWVADRTARALGGRGSPTRARAALAWGSAPLLIGSGGLMVAVAVDNAALAAVAGAAAVICSVWAVLRCAWMLSHTHAFARWRAFISLTIAGVLSGLVGGALALPIRVLVVQPFSIESRSMVPTLLAGDYLLASKSAYGWSRHSLPWAPQLFEGRILGREPQRGDVILFANPRDGVAWIKRVVGLPGDTVQMVAGRLVINGETVARRQLATSIQTQDHAGKPITTPISEETLPGGATYQVIAIDNGQLAIDNTRPFVAPPGHYFVLGDNRDNSADSRLSADQGGIGFVPFENIIAKAAVIFNSTRPERFGTEIR